MTNATVPSNRKAATKDRTATAAETVNPAARSLPGPAALARKTRKSPRNSASRAHGRRRPAGRASCTETRATPSGFSLHRRVPIKRSQVSASNGAGSTRPPQRLPRRLNDCAKRGYKVCNGTWRASPASVSKTTHSAKPSGEARRTGATPRNPRSWHGLCFCSFARGHFPQ